ncbi:MAG TPA: T9SS type A sorting domain-containing protein, partial [Phaeodactylibacter sp.]|nr:T9SS type A sorting domain-containing protein [Phaeodactylibacter sp.]
SPLDQFGIAVSINSNGSIVASSSMKSDVNGEKSGQVRIFQYVNGSWEQKGQDIVGTTTFEKFGYSISLNEDGSRIGCGSLRHRAKVYAFSNNTSTSAASSPSNTPSIYPNPSNDIFHIHLPQKEVGYLNIFNVHGKLLYTWSGFTQNKPLQINASSWNSGIYFLNYRTTRGFYTAKLLKTK